MPYNQRNNEKPDKPVKREITARDLETIYSDLPAYQGTKPTERWPEKDLRLIWNRCIPADAAIGDVIYFLYACQTRGLDPLLSEAYLRMQWDRQSGAMKPVIIIGIGGALKLAEATHEMDGAPRPSFETDPNTGELISATATIWKKGASHPFESTVYYREYVATDRNGQVVSMWQTKGHMMLGKCALMAALRLAFASALSGMYVSEEFAQRDAEETKFVVESTDQPPTSGVQTLKVAEPAPPPAPLPTPPPADPAPEPSPQQRNRALSQRIMTDLSIPTKDRKSILQRYFVGFLDLLREEDLPKDPAFYLAPLRMLDELSLTNNQDGALTEGLATDPEGIGRAAKIEFDTWFRKEWGFETAALGRNVAMRFGYTGFDELRKYLQANGISLAQEADVQAFLRLALIDRELAKAAGIRSDAAGVPMDILVEGLEHQLGGPLENFTAAAVRSKFDEKEKGVTA